MKKYDVISLVPGIILIFLGLFVMSAWAFKMESLALLYPDFFKMVFNTAFCFTLVGIGLILSVFFLHKIQAIKHLIGLILIIFSGIVLSQYIFDYYAGIDEIFLTFWGPNLQLLPGRMAPSTSLTFMVIGFIFILFPYGSRKAIGATLQVLVFFVLLFGFIGLVGNGRKLEFIYGWYHSVQMSIHSALGFIICGIGLWTTLIQTAWYKDFYVEKEDQKITFFCGAILISVTLTLELLNLGITSYHLDKYQKDILAQYLDNSGEIIKTELNHTIQYINDIMDNPLIEYDNKTDFQEIPELLMSHGFSGVRLSNSRGEVVVKGKIIENPEHSVSLNGQLDKVDLLWDKELTLRIRKNISRKEKTISLLAEFPLKKTRKLFSTIIKTSGSSEMLICGLLKEDQATCFPTKFNPHPFIIPIKHVEYLSSISNAFFEKDAGVTITRDYRDQFVFAAYDLLKPFGLALVFKRDAKEVYEPLLNQLWVVIPLILALIIAGLLALYWQILPLIRKVISSEQRSRENLKLVRERESKLTAIVNNADEAIITNNEDGKIQTFNPRASALFGYEEKEIIGKNFTVLLPENIRTLHLKEIKEYIKTGQTQIIGKRWIEITSLRKNGTTFPTELFVIETFGVHGRVFTAMIRDLTGRKKTEIERRQANEKLERGLSELTLHNQQTSLLNELSSVLQSCQKIEETYTPIAKIAQNLFPQFSGTVFLEELKGKSFEAVASWGEAQMTSISFSPQDCWALRRGHPYQVEGTGTLICGHIKPLDEKDPVYLCVPIIAQGETVGLMYFEYKNVKNRGGLLHHKEGEITQSVHLLCKTFVDQVALTLSNIKLTQSLHNQSIRDPLTGLFNRRYLEETLKREISMAIRHSTTLVAIMIDVDHFKRINDVFGHDVGDLVLKRISSLFQEHVRESDIVCRWGGEEFIIILPDSSLEIAKERAEKLRSSVQKLSLVDDDRTLDSITISLGIALYPDHAGTKHNLIEAADQAMYKAKQLGRNQVIVFEEEKLPARKN